MPQCSLHPSFAKVELICYNFAVYSKQTAAQENDSTDLYARNSEKRGIAMTQDDLLTVEEVARQLRVDVTTVRRWITNGSLHAIRLPSPGKRQVYRIKQSMLDAILKPE
jgi:excisionase family DNA binding protein